MIRTEAEYQEASARLADERQRRAEHRSRVGEAGLRLLPGPEGVYSFNGDRERRISGPKLDPLFKGESTRVGNVEIPPVNQGIIQHAVMTIRNGRLYLSYASGSNTRNDTTLVCNLDAGSLYSYKLASSFAETGFTTLYEEGTGGALIGAVRGAKLNALETGNHDDGEPIPLIWQSRFSDQGAPDREKVYQNLTLAYSTADVGDALGPALPKRGRKFQFVAVFVKKPQPIPRPDTWG